MPPTLNPLVIAPGPEAIQYPIGVEQGAVYSIMGPDGTRAVFNNPGDRDFVGYLTDPPSGLERAAVRENGEDLAGGDGGIHGDFLYGRLAFTLSGIVYPDPLAAAILRQAKLLRATNAMRADATLSWIPAVAGVPVQVRFRQQQATRITSRRPKTFLVAGVSEDPAIYSADAQVAQYVFAGGGSGAGSVVAIARGTARAWPLVTFYGPVVNPQIVLAEGGGALYLNITLGAGESVTVDTAPRRRTIVSQAGVNRYSALAFLASTWGALVPGTNTLSFAATSYGAGAYAAVTWRDAWG